MSNRRQLISAIGDLRSAKRLSLDATTRPYVIGLTRQEVDRLSSREFANRGGVLIIDLSGRLDVEDPILFIAERLDLCAIEKARNDPEAGLEDVADHIVMESEIYKKIIERTTMLSCNNFLAARRAVQKVRGRLVHPSRAVLGNLPPNLHPTVFDILGVPHICHLVSFLYHLVLQEADCPGLRQET